MQYQDLFTPEEQEQHNSVITPYLQKWWDMVQENTKTGSNLDAMAPLHCYSSLMTNSVTLVVLQPIEQALAEIFNAALSGNVPQKKILSQIKDFLKIITGQITTCANEIALVEDVFAGMKTCENEKEVENG